MVWKYEKNSFFYDKIIWKEILIPHHKRIESTSGPMSNDNDDNHFNIENDIPSIATSQPVTIYSCQNSSHEDEDSINLHLSETQPSQTRQISPHQWELKNNVLNTAVTQISGVPNILPNECHTVAVDKIGMESMKIVTNEGIQGDIISSESDGESKNEAAETVNETRIANFMERGREEDVFENYHTESEKSATLDNRNTAHAIAIMAHETVPVDTTQICLTDNVVSDHSQEDKRNLTDCRKEIHISLDDEEQERKLDDDSFSSDTTTTNYENDAQFTVTQELQ